MWCVWLVTYATYEELAHDGDKPPRLIAGPMQLGQALRKVEELGFGYCAKPM